jgi:hypothetical protein
LFAEEEAHLALAIAAAHGESQAVRLEVERADDVSRRFEEVARVLEDLDIDRAWAAATASERRILIEELVENVTVLPDHLEVTVSGAPRLHVRYQEVGLKESGPDRVGGGTRHNAVSALDAYPAWGSAHVGARINGNPVREVGTTELWLPAA